MVALNFLASYGYGESPLCDGFFHSRLKQWVARNISFVQESPEGGYEARALGLSYLHSGRFA
jgi:hypothetical protein